MKIKHLLLFVLITASTSVVGQKIRVTKLPVSTHANNEMAPFIKDSVLYFSTNKPTTVLKKYYDDDKMPLYHIFAAQLKADSTFGDPTRYMESYLSPFNTGSMAVSHDGQLLVVGQNKFDSYRKSYKSKTGNPLALYVAERQGSTWSARQEITFEAFEDYNITQPAISTDGEMLFFASDAPGGLGKSDLYYSEKKNGQWETPRNLGSDVNTDGSEVFPFYHPGGRLYFSSNGHGGQGGLDLFYTQKTAQGWSEPVALESPINTAANDYSCFISEDGLWGIYASDIDGNDNLYRYDQLFPTFENCALQTEDSFCYEFFDNMTLDNTLEGPYQYRWTFNDNETVNGDTVMHCFPGPGEYRVKLSMVDSSVDEELFALSEYPLSVQRTEQIYISCPDTVKVNELVSLSINESNFGPFNPKAFYWEMDDGTSLTGETIQFIFRKKGKHLIQCGTVSADDPQLKWCSMKEIIVSD